MTNRILIVDDEPLARMRLVAMLDTLKDEFSLEVIGEAENGEDALAKSLQYKPDIILLDIRMPNMDGLQVARHLSHMDDPPAIIFATAYDEHALAAFEAHAIGYLVKPVRKNKLLDALQHAQRINKKQALNLAIETDGNSTRDKFCVNKRGQLLLIPVDQIYYFMADQKYVSLFYMLDGELKEEIIDETLKELEDEFSDRFIRVHRNALVAKHTIERMNRDNNGHYQLFLSQVETGLDVSRRKVKDVKNILLSK